MLSIANISVGQASSGYYRQDGYYAKESDEAREASQWFGKGAEAAGLSGYVDPKTFDDVMKGINPDGVQMGRKDSNGEIAHRAGMDLTFSPSKSVSIVALVGGDERVIQAHDKAVQTALAYVEDRYLNTRVWNAETKKQDVVGNQKMFAGVFRHDTSRNMDPQLHSHAVVANMTIGEDGKWRSIDNSQILRHKMQIGGVYRNALAKELTARGFEIERVGEHGYVEIKGVSQEVKDHFSTRREEIEQALKSADSPTSAAAAARAAIWTRSAKEQNVDRDALYQLWREEAAAKGLDRAALDTLRERTSQPVTITDLDVRRDADEAIKYAVAHVSERASVYERDDIEMLAYVVTKVASHEDVALAIDRKIESGELIRGANAAFENALTDRESIGRELAVLDEFKMGQGAGRALATERVIQRTIYKDTLNDGQMFAVKTALTTVDRFVGVQGYAGTGKTFMLSKMQAVAEKQGYEVVGLAPSNKAVGELNEVGIAAGTLQGFLAKYQGLSEGRMSEGAVAAMTAEFTNKLIVLDESSMTDTRQMRDLMNIANRIDAPKVVLLGDTKQLDAVGAGTPFRALQNEGMQTAVMNDIRRQEDPRLLEAVMNTIKGEIHKAFDMVGDNVTSHKREAPVEAAKKWLSLSDENRAKTILITQSNAWRGEINNTVRDGLKGEGKITGADVVLDRLEALRHTKAEAGRMENYVPGMTIIFERNVRGMGIERGAEFTVIGTSDKGVELKGQDDKRIYFDPAKSAHAANSISAYRQTTIGLAAGDVIRFDRPDKDRGIENKATGDIAQVDDKTVSIKLHGEDEARAFNRSDALIKHIDYGFSVTVHGAQGATVQNVIAAMDSASILSTMKSFYVTISRAKEGAEIFTDDAGQLRTVIAKATGERVSALDAIGFRDAMRNLTAAHQEAARLRGGGPEADNIYFLKFSDGKNIPLIRADRSEHEPSLPGLERPKADDPDLRDGRTPDREPIGKDEKADKARGEDESKERTREPREDRAQQELRDTQEHNRGVPQERDQPEDRDRGYER